MLWIWILLSAAVLLVVGTVWFVARPLRRAAVVIPGTPRHELELVRERLVAQLNEIDAERVDKGMDPQIARDEELRVSAELAAVLKQLEQLPADSGEAREAGGSRRLWLVTVVALAIILPTAAVSLDAIVNGPTLEGMLRIAEGRAQAQADLPPMVLAMVAKLHRQLIAQPDDPVGWARLAHSYFVLGRKGDAFKAYAKAYRMAPENSEIVSDYAWAKFTDNPGKTSGLVFTLYSQLHKLQPDNPDALWFLGLAAYHNGDPAKTIVYWKRLAALIPGDNPAHHALLHGIAQVQAQMQAAERSHGK